MASVTVSPTSITSVLDGFGGNIAWTNPSNALTSNDSYATNVLFDEGTQSLVCVFDLSLIPVDATLTGIKVETELKVTLGTNTNAAIQVFLFENDDQINPSSFRNPVGITNTADEYIPTGAADDDWGGVTLADLLSPNFSVHFNIYGDGIGGTVSVDHIRLTAYYTGGTVPSGSGAAMTAF